MKMGKGNLFYSSDEISGIHFKIFASPNGITNIFINKKNDNETAATKLQNDDPYFFNVFKQLTEYFNGRRTSFKIPLDINGTDFQMKVWNELQKIPFGKTISYKKLAENIGDVKTIRAVGGANGANPVPVIIPCHRVINSDGSLGGYSCGLHVKQRLLELEGGLSLKLFE